MPLRARRDDQVNEAFVRGPVDVTFWYEQLHEDIGSAWLEESYTEHFLRNSDGRYSLIR